MLPVIAWVSTSGVTPEVLSLSGVTLIEWGSEVAFVDGVYVDLLGCASPAMLLASLPALPLLIDATCARTTLDLPPGACVLTDPSWSVPVVAAWVEGLRGRRQARVLLRHDVWNPVAVLAGHLEMFAEGLYGPMTPRLDGATMAMKRAVAQLEGQLNDVGAQLFGGRGDGTEEKEE